MDDTVSEDSTCQLSVVGKTKVNPEASQTLQSPAEKQSSYGDSFMFPKGRRRKAKLPADPKPQTPKDVTKQSSNSIPLFKQPAVIDPNFVFHWNAGRKRKHKKSPSDVPTPQIVLIDKIPIYIQKLTAAQAVANGVVGWDQFLADVEQLHNDAAVSRIASFWATWKRQLQLTR